MQDIYLPHPATLTAHVKPRILARSQTEQVDHRNVGLYLLGIPTAGSALFHTLKESAICGQAAGSNFTFFFFLAIFLKAAWRKNRESRFESIRIEITPRRNERVVV